MQALALAVHVNMLLDVLKQDPNKLTKQSNPRYALAL